MKGAGGGLAASRTTAEQSLKNPPATAFSLPRTLQQEGRTSQRPGRFLKKSPQFLEPLSSDRVIR
jgi:hypothetical protein